MQLKKAKKDRDTSTLRQHAAWNPLNRKQEAEDNIHPKEYKRQSTVMT